MRLLFLILFFATAFTAEGQHKKLSKRKLYKAFTESIVQENKKEGRISTLSNPWITNNDDSVYFKSDTIRFINFHKRYSNLTFCATINWSFYEKDKFFRVHEMNCQAQIYWDAPEFKISIDRHKKDFIIRTWNITTGNPVMADTFMVIDLTSSQTMSTLTLIRLKK